jgi:hypothetical protein
MDKDDEKPFTEEEIKYLEKTIKDTYVSYSIYIVSCFF